MRPMAKILLYLLFLPFVLASFIIHAHAQERFEDWAKKQREALQRFKEERDRQFYQFLQKEWREMQSFQGERQDSVPKPVALPVAKSVDPVDRGRAGAKPGLQLSPPSKPKSPEKLPLPQTPPVETIQVAPPPDRTSRPVELDFFLTKLRLYMAQKHVGIHVQKLDKATFSTAWHALSESPYQTLLEQAQSYRKHLGLNDWGYGALLQSIATAAYPESDRQQTIYLWFLLLKSGYDARIAYDRSNVFLLIPTQQALYGIRYVTLDGRRYYSFAFHRMPPEMHSVYTYPGKYPEAEKTFDLRFVTLPRLHSQPFRRSLGFEYGGRDYQFSVAADRSLVDFLEYYPQTELTVYFEAPASQSAERSLLGMLKPIVAGKSEKIAVNMLLRFVQTAFAYKTDQQQFAREKYMFPDETIYYAYSDCEDRSILFAYLVKNLLHLDVVVLDYPGHIATAVRFSSQIKGDTITYKGKKYIVCDPTYINANLGMTLPQVKGITPKVIEVKA